MDLSIITVAWNSDKFISEQLRSVFDSTGDFKFEIFVVDNNSSDNTVSVIKKNFPQVKLIVNSSNNGFAKANNQAIEESSGRYVLLLNPDMRVFPETLSDMVKYMDTHPYALVAGCKLIDQEGKNVPHVRRFPRLFDQLMILLKVPHLFPGVLNKYLMRDFDYENEAQVDSIRGSFFMIRREVIDQLGGLDERFFIWFEEVDYCKQAADRGMKVVYTPTVKCVDYVGKSFALVGGLKKQKYFTRSMVQYFKKWHPWKASLIIIARPFAIAVAWIGQKLK